MLAQLHPPDCAAALIVRISGCYLRLPLPAPPREKTAAREDQTGQSSTGDWAGNGSVVYRHCYSCGRPLNYKGTRAHESARTRQLRNGPKRGSGSVAPADGTFRCRTSSSFG
jgi:hypothetical protein